MFYLNIWPHYQSLRVIEQSLRIIERFQRIIEQALWVLDVTWRIIEQSWWVKEVLMTHTPVQSAYGPGHGR